VAQSPELDVTSRRISKRRSSYLSRVLGSLQKVTVKKPFKTVVPLHRELARGTLIDILHHTQLKKEELIELVT